MTNARTIETLEFSIEGRKFYVRRDAVIAIGESPVSTDAEGVIHDASTVITVEGIGMLPVGETMEKALRLWRGRD